MANARLAKFITEVAPPQYVHVIRNRASKMLDTINEEDRDGTANNSLSMPKSPSTAIAGAASTSAATPATNSKYFLRGGPKKFFDL